MTDASNVESCCILRSSNLWKKKLLYSNIQTVSHLKSCCNEITALPKTTISLTQVSYQGFWKASFSHPSFGASIY